MQVNWVVKVAQLLNKRLCFQSVIMGVTSESGHVSGLQVFTTQLNCFIGTKVQIPTQMPGSWMTSTTDACVSVCSFVPASKASNLIVKTCRMTSTSGTSCCLGWVSSSWIGQTQKAFNRLLRYFYYSFYLFYWYKSAYTGILFVVKRLAAKRLLRYPIFLLLSLLALLVQKYRYWHR
jgi:hypothetical protein